MSPSKFIQSPEHGAIRRGLMARNQAAQLNTIDKIPVRPPWGGFTPDQNPYDARPADCWLVQGLIARPVPGALGGEVLTHPPGYVRVDAPRLGLGDNANSTFAITGIGELARTNASGERTGEFDITPVTWTAGDGSSNGSGQMWRINPSTSQWVEVAAVTSGAGADNLIADRGRSGRRGLEVPTYTTEAAGSEDGSVAAGDVWFTTATTLTPNVGTGEGWIALVFNLPDQALDSEGRRLEIPVITAASISFRSLTSGGRRFQIFTVPDDTQRLYVNSANPGQRGESIGLNRTSTTDTTHRVFNAVLDYSSETEFTITIPSDSLVKLNAAFGHNLNTASRLCLSFYITDITGGNATATLYSSEHGFNLPPTLTTTEEDVTHTGTINMSRRTEDQTRSRLCPRLGYPVDSREMIHDGYLEGLKVSPKAWDPEDVIEPDGVPGEILADDEP